MTINDPIFGELEYEYGWTKDTIIRFFGKESEISLMIDGEEDGEFDEEQYMAYQALMQNWEELQPSLLQSILDYYKQERQELGYDIEVNESYPLVETANEILEMISLDGIVVPYAGIFDGRDIGITFNCTWDIENGLGIRLLNEKVTEVGYQDVAI
ncbi:DUF2004 domain-containing protein [Bacillus cytotoxicus]|uniref:DUF2004 domain-containing protein n=1 Tax=Bacillus cereus group sp. BfR-BA-01492 TaxID=2920361 RepID=UPI001F5A47BC|nr:DUF2004 domain-containing protein [Bacillus cereus group sp. BfR-BA-01492]EMA6344706.1 DUF2004 domain-containing protein [Bacillus cytotoxicus]